MKLIPILFLILTVTKTCNQSGTIPFLEATSQNYSGGAAGSMKGTYYRIKLAGAENPDYVFDSLWVNSKRIRIEIKHSESKDTLVLFANDKINMLKPPDQGEVSAEPKLVPFPISSKAEGVLGYFYKGKREYFEINSWKQLPPIFYP